jgi:hypothetical protein
MGGGIDDQFVPHGLLFWTAAKESGNGISLHPSAVRSKTFYALPL